MLSGKHILKLVAIILAVLTLSACKNDKELVLIGVVESVMIDANSEVSGKVIDINIDEGAPVKKGDVLATIDSSMHELSLKQQEAVVRIKAAKLEELKLGSREQQIKQAEAAAKAAKAKLDELKAGSRPEQIKQAEAAVESARANLESNEMNYNYLLEKYTTIKALYESNAASKNELDDIRVKTETSQKQLKASMEQLNSAAYQLELLKNGATSEAVKAAEANFEQSQAQLELLKSGSTEQALNAAQADFEQSLALLEQLKLTLSKYSIRSEIDGTYVSRSVNIGDIVSPGTNIGSVSDLSDLRVNIFIPRHSLKYISLGQELNLSSSGENIKGIIDFISSEAEFTPKNVETTEAKENMVFKVRIGLKANDVNLKPGMLVDAYIPTGGK
ncbi:MAG: HlyD family efflux transporter periplasmic adaptor subunit [Clostridiaceae bacterium]|nr:HlyD family efflux transporter periplasmic adaptor subunit [Clostridiaceae bacterium]